MVTAARASERGRVLAALSYLLLTGVGFFGLSAVIRPLVPWPGEYGLRDKFEYFEEHKDEYDIVFLGSSRLWRSIVPERFDKELALRGTDARSFNFGVGGMRVWEMDHVLRRILELEPAKLKWILIEGGDWDPGFPSVQNTFASRSVFWHDGEETRKAIEATWTADLELMARMRLTSIHAQLYLRRVANYGQGKLIVRDLRGLPDFGIGRHQEEGYFIQAQGFQTQDALVHSGFLQRVDEYWAEVERIPELNNLPVDLDHVYQRALHDQYAATKVAGIELIHIIPPGIEGAPVRRSLHQAGVIPTLFDFNRPERFPKLFAEETHFSPDHLNLRGAEEFTRTLVTAFTRHLRGEDFR